MVRVKAPTKTLGTLQRVSQVVPPVTVVFTRRTIRGQRVIFVKAKALNASNPALLILKSLLQIKVSEDHRRRHR